MDAMFYRRRPGWQSESPDATGRCSSRSADLRFQEWTTAGVFQRLWAQGLRSLDELTGIDWEGQAMDADMTKAPLGEEKTGPNQQGPRQTRGEAWLVSGR